MIPTRIDADKEEIMIKLDDAIHYAKAYQQTLKDIQKLVKGL